MVIDSKYTITFDSNSLTKKKFNELITIATHIRDVKNQLSKQISENLFNYLDVQPLTYVTNMRKQCKGQLSSYLDKDAFQQVITAYQNKFDSIVKGLRFEQVIFKGFSFYKRNGKKHKKGDMKGVKLERKSTPLSICLTYLARYGNEDTVKYIQHNIDKQDDKKRKFYENILACIGKFSFDRLYTLALTRRNRIVKQKNKKPIEFRSLTFSGRSRKKTIVDYNQRYGSNINAFVTLSGLGRQSFHIPVKFCKDYHGNIRDYQKNSNDYQYVMTFSECHHQVNVLLCKDGQRYIPEANGEVVGIDVNVKHNLFTLSDGTTYDYDRELVKEYCRTLTQIDQLKKGDKEYKVGKRKQTKLDKLKEKVVKHEQGVIVNMCKHLLTQGVGHIVMENLNNSFGRSYVKDEEGMNYNRRVKLLGISSLKREVEHIARKYGIAVSTVHAEYTSQTCPVCGCVDSENRETQEEFHCVECCHTNNADVNAAINIRNRVTVTVLRDKLLKQLDNGAFEPKKLKREKVKDVLLSCRSCCSNTAEKHSTC